MSQVKVKQKYLSCLIGVIAMVGLSALFVLAFSIFILDEYLPMEYTKVYLVISMGIVAFAGALIVGLLERDGARWMPMLSTGIYCVLWLFAAIFLFNGISVNALYGLVACTVGCGMAFAVLNRTKNTQSRRKKRRVYR